MKGFFAGESVPVNQALSDVFIKLHITEHTGRGVPRITEAYGNDVIRFSENSIVVTIPFERLGQEVYADGQTTFSARDGIPQVSGQIPQVEGEIPQDHLGIKDRKTVRKYLNPLIEQGRIARTIPDKPNSRLQKDGNATATVKVIVPAPTPVPKTGDNANPLLWILLVLLGVSLLGITVKQYSKK